MKHSVAFSSLIRLTRALPPVRNYYRGLVHGRSRDGALPDNLLLFSRGANDPGALPALRDFHRRFVLIVSLAGRGTVEIDATPFDLKPGSGLLIRPYQFHCYPRIPPAPFCWLFVTFDRPHAEKISAAPRPVPLTGDMAHLVQMLLRPVHPQPGSADAAWRMALVLATFLDLFEHATLEKTTAGHPTRDAAPSWATQLIQAIRTPRRSTARIEDLAEHIGWSASHLRAEFRQRFGVSLGRYLRDYRLNEARGLLARQEHSLEQIATECGFGSVYSFCRAFSRAAGMPPARYRRQIQLRNGVDK